MRLAMRLGQRPLNHSPLPGLGALPGAIIIFVYVPMPGCVAKPTTLIRCRPKASMEEFGRKAAPGPAASGQRRSTVPIHPKPSAWRKERLVFPSAVLPFRRFRRSNRELAFGDQALAAGHAHVARQRWSLMPTIDHEIMAFRLSRDRLIDGRMQ